MRRRICRSTNWRGCIPFLTGDSRLPQEFHTLLCFRLGFVWNIANLISLPGCTGAKRHHCPDFNPLFSRIGTELANQHAVLVGTSDQDPTPLTSLSPARSSRAWFSRCAVLNQPEAGKPTKSQKESCMKLNSAQVERALMQFE